MEQLEVLKIVIEKLKSLSIEYMLTGSVAMNYYGQPRMTRDIDIVIVIDEPKIKKFIAAFKEEFYVNSETVFKEAMNRGMFNVIHNEYIVKVDFILQKNTEYDITAFERRKLIKVNDLHICVISSEDLILNKLVWAREGNSEIQKRDVKNILMMTEDLDLDYVRHWSIRLDVASILEECKP